VISPGASAYNAIVEAILCDLNLRRRRFDLRAQRSQHLDCLIVAHARGVAAVQQLTLATVVELRLEDLPLGRGKARLAGSKGILFILRVKPGDQLTCIDLVTDID
jgi:hypothetical protein